MEFLIILAGLIFDRVTKVWALNNLRSKEDIDVIKGIFTFQYVENRGAAFGFLQNKVIILTIVTLLVIGFMIFYIIKYKPKSLLFKISISMILSGALGNLIDRICYKFVVDFIFFHYKEVWTFPNFNIADSFVVVGTILLALYIIRDVK
jgi:lipoprotein signal peptidase